MPSNHTAARLASKKARNVFFLVVSPLFLLCVMLFMYLFNTYIYIYIIVIIISSINNISKKVVSVF